MRKNVLRSLSAIALAAAMSASMFTFTACGNKDNNQGNGTPNLTDKALEGETLADWSDGAVRTVFESDGWSNGSVFNTQWKADNVKYENGAMKLTITENPDGSEATNNEYFGGEGRTYQYFGYGDFEVCMKPAKKVGTASTFFTCTGDYDTNPITGKPNPWDEIDIEFLGSDTTKVQFNYYVNGQGGHEYMYNLGFDASEEFHEYGFRWTEDYIVWFVDDEPVYKVEASTDNPLPSTAGRILMNYWCGTEEAEGWMGEYSNPGSEGAEYKWVKTSAQAEWGEIPEEVEVEEFEGDWSTIGSLPLDLEASTNEPKADYAITPSEDGKSANVTWTTAGAYNNVSFVVDEEDSLDKNWLHMVLKNNSETETTNVRINVRSTAGTTSTTTNSYGFGNGELLRTNAGEGTFIDLAPGAEVEIEIRYAGVVDKVEIMLDSLQSGAVEKNGNVTISDVKLAKQGEIEEVKPSENNGVTINDTNVKFETTLYTINTDAETNSMNVTYANCKGNRYSNISAVVSSIAKDKNLFSFKVVNNGTETVKFRVDMLLADGTIASKNITVAGDSVCSQSDSSYFEVAAGVTETVTVEYTGAPDKVNIFIDSCTWNDETTHSGDVTFSEMAFSGEASEPEEPEEPVVPGEWTAIDLSATTVGGSTVGGNDPVYTATKNDDNTLDVTYTDLAGNSYKVVELQGISSTLQTRNVFTAKITNNGTETVNLRVNITANKVGNNDSCNVSATQDGNSVRTDAEWGGSFFTVEAGATITVQVVYDNTRTLMAVQFMVDSSVGDENLRSGNITISEMALALAE